MRLNRKKLTITVLSGCLVLLLFLFFRHPQPLFEIKDYDITSISGTLTSEQNAALPRLLKLILLADDDKIIVQDDGLRQFAKTNIVTMFNRNDFLHDADFNGIKPEDTVQLGLITDQSYQMLAIPPRLPEGQNKLYFQTEDNSLIPSLPVIINNKSYIASNLSDSWYVVSDFSFTASKVLAIKTNVNLLYTYLVVRSNDRSAIADSSQVTIGRSKISNLFNINFPEQKFALMTLSKNQIISNLGNSLAGQPTNFTFHKFTEGNSADWQDLASVNHGYLIKEPGRYLLNDSDPTIIRIFLSLLVLPLLLILIVSFSRTEEFLEITMLVRRQINKNYFWIITYLFFMNALTLAIGSSGRFGLSRKSLLALVILPFLGLARFAIIILVLFGAFCLELTLFLGLLGYHLDFLSELVFFCMILVLAKLAGSALFPRIALLFSKKTRKD